MPNWVTNHLRIEGDKQQLDNIAKQLNRPFTKRPKDCIDREWKYVDVAYSEPVFAFWNIIRPDDQMLAEYFGDEADASDPSHHWYEWNLKHWGTKWDVGRPDGTQRDTTKGNRIADAILEYQFETAWSQPDQALLALSDQYPTVTFLNHHQEETEDQPTTSIYQAGITDLPERRDGNDETDLWMQVLMPIDPVSGPDE